MKENPKRETSSSPRFLSFLSRLPHPLRFISVFLLGGFLIIAGTFMLVLPGPGILTIALGLAIWGTEFEWAARILQTSKGAGTSAYRWGRGKVTKKKESTSE